MPDKSQFRGLLDGFMDGSAFHAPGLPRAQPDINPIAQQTGWYDTDTQTFLPPDVSVPVNMLVAAQRPWDLPWFYSRVHTGAPWDYKQRGAEDKIYEDAGNFNYGATGTAMGLLPWLLYRAAGVNQIWNHGFKKGQGTPFGGPPYGDDPRDQIQISRGIAYARRHST